MQVISSFGENDLSMYTFMPPEMGRLLPNSSITRAPQYEMIPATLHRTRHNPGLPASWKMVVGVEKILFFSRH